MANRNNFVTFEEAAARIGILPLLESRPNTKNIRVVSKALAKALQGAPLYQSQTFGFMGFITTPGGYALTGELPWQNFPDPGFHRQLGGTVAVKRGTKAQCNVAKNFSEPREREVGHQQGSHGGGAREVLASRKRHWISHVYPHGRS